MNLDLDHQALGVHQQMALSAPDILTSVETSIFSAYPGGLDRLASTMPALGSGSRRAPS